MTLREARCAFTLALADLILWAVDAGYEVALDEATERITERDPTSDHMKKSLHHIGLAADLLLYRDGRYLSLSEDHEATGARWEEMGRERGLPLANGRKWQDGNHYSLAWEGRK